MKIAYSLLGIGEIVVGVVGLIFGLLASFENPMAKPVLIAVGIAALAKGITYIWDAWGTTTEQGG